MPPAVAIAGAAVVGAGASIYAGNKAAKAQKSAADSAAASSAAGLEEQRRQYDTTRADYAPYRQVGYGALGKLAGLSGVQAYGADGQPIGDGSYNDGGFTASPGYQFRLAEGVKAAERSAAARGLLASGGTMKAIQRYGEGLAASEFDSYTSRLAQLAGVGQSATGATAAAGSQLGNAAQTAAGQIGNAQLAAGNATAAGYGNTASSINTGLNNLAASYLYSKTPTGFGGATPGIY